MGRNAARIGWIDTAKGGSALLVVLWHAFLIARLGGHFPGLLASLNVWLMHVRMPIFFLASGILSERLVQAPLAELLWKRIVPLLWVLVIWTTVDGAVNDLFPLYPWLGDSLPGLDVLLWRPQGELWFLYDLLVLTFMARIAVATQGWRRIGIVLALFALTVAYHRWRSEYFTYGLVSNFPFFMLGVLGAAQLRKARTTPVGLALLVLLSIAGIGAARVSLEPGEIRGMAESLFCVGLGVAVAVAIQALPRLARLFDAVGRRSLAVFLGHVPIMAATFAAMPPQASRLHPLAIWLGLFTIAIVGSLLLERAASRLGLGWLYRLPAYFKVRLPQQWAGPAPHHQPKG